MVSTAQLRGIGFSADAVKRRVHAGRLHRVHRGVYAVGHPGLGIEGKWMAAVLACGAGSNQVAMNGIEAVSGAPKELRPVLDRWGAALSHRSAAAHWGLLPAAHEPVCVSVTGIGGRRRRMSIHVHRSRTLVPELVTMHRGIPLTTPKRTIEDLRKAIRTRGCPASISPRDLRRAIRQAEVLGLATGSESLTEGTRSDLELAFLRLCRRHNLPRPEVNPRIDSLQVDFLWRDRKLVVETDGYRYHRGKAAFDGDRDRDLKLRALGYEVIRLSYRQVIEEPMRIGQLLNSSLRS